MSDRFSSSTPILMLIALLIAVAATLVIAQAGNPTPGGGAALTVPDSTRIVQDSVYAEINGGFGKLQPIFEKSCFDCHTNRTRFPWYYKLPLVKGMIDSDIRGAHKKLDMDNGFPFSKRGNIADDLVNIHDEIHGNDMPPLMYRFMHWDAKPSPAEKDSVYQWINQGLKALSAIGIEPTSQPEGDDQK
jgi:hypothetical protein